MTHPILIDVSAVVVRGYFADAKLASDAGRAHMPMAQLTNMVESLTRTFRLEPGQPAAAALDPRGPTWRHDPARGGSWDYKAKRKPKPPGLGRLLRDAPALFEAFGWPTIAADGYEADDVLCSLAHRSTGAVIVSPDKDMHQILGARQGLPWGSMPDLSERGCRVWNPLKIQPDAPAHVRGGWVEWMDAWDKWGVDIRKEPTTKILELQALQGDTVDGITGCPGIGPKVAALLIEEYGTAEGAIAAAQAGAIAAHIPQRAANAKRLVEHAEAVRTSWRLARLVPDLDVTPGRFGTRDDAAIGRLLDAWEGWSEASEDNETPAATAAAAVDW